MTADVLDGMPDGATRLYIIVGDPIVQVKSPGGMTRSFTARAQFGRHRRHHSA